MLELEWWRVAPFVLSVPPQLAFVLMYSLPVFGAGEWWSDFTGRALFFKSTAILTLITLSTASLGLLLWAGAARVHWDFSFDSAYGTLPDPYGPILAVLDFVTAVFYWVLLATIIYQLSALIHERKYLIRFARWVISREGKK